MNSASTIHTNSKCASPKTPGGISKSLLTPCRRLGLSRKWKKNGSAPFVSPLTSINVNKTVEVIEKKCCSKKESNAKAVVEEYQNESKVYENLDNEDEEEKSFINTTPKHVVPLRKTKSKSLKTIFANDNALTDNVVSGKETYIESRNSEENDKRFEKCKDQIFNDSSPVCASMETSNLTSNNLSSFLVADHNVDITKCFDSMKHNNISEFLLKNNVSEQLPKQMSPGELSKECIVVLQRKMFKTNSKMADKNLTKEKVKDNAISQALFDSDTDDVPLSTMTNKLPDKANPDNKKRPRIINDNDDFCESSRVSTKVMKLENKSTSTGDLKQKNSNAKKVNGKSTSKVSKTNSRTINITNLASQDLNSCNDDDEDFDLNCKKTILIRKTYDKVTKPLKAKSTGSITQKDINDLKARIEMKKNLLLAKTVTKDTDELRSLIKRWKKGCQNALMELMDLMKLKCPEKKSMDYSEILQLLQIPPALVGYDSDNDCFLTPDDASLILSRF